MLQAGGLEPFVGDGAARGVEKEVIRVLALVMMLLLAGSQASPPSRRRRRVHLGLSRRSGDVRACPVEDGGDGGAEERGAKDALCSGGGENPRQKE